MIKQIVSLNSLDFRGLIRKRGEFRFVNQADMMRLFIRIFYPNTAVVVIYDCKKAFEIIPKLTIKKRDDFTSYMLGSMSDMVFVEFDTPLLASDWAFSFTIKSGIRWEIFNNGVLIRNDKGVVKALPPPKLEED